MHLPRRLTLCAAAAFLGGSALASTSGLVISQVYGGGGNSGATYKNDFIELFNAGSATINLNGYSVQYASATGAAWQVTHLRGSIAPGHYYLIQQAPGAAGTTALPTPDATGSIPMSSSAAKVALVSSTTALSVAAPTGAAIIDFVGYGAANFYEGSAPASALSNTLADLRVGAGCIDTNSNSVDFSAAAPLPRNAATAAVDCTGTTPPPSDPTPSPRASTTSRARRTGRRSRAARSPACPASSPRWRRTASTSKTRCPMPTRPPRKPCSSTPLRHPP